MLRSNNTLAVASKADIFNVAPQRLRALLAVVGLLVVVVVVSVAVVVVGGFLFSVFIDNDNRSASLL